MISLASPIIRARIPAGVSLASLPNILDLCRSSELVDLPGMRADQRAPVVTTLAILVHLEGRYEKRLDTADLVLVTAPGTAAFLQPILKGKVVPFPITDLDHTATGVAHSYKPTDEVEPEQAFFALVAGTWRHSMGRRSASGARQRLLTVLLGDGVTLASEVMELARAYDLTAPSHTPGRDLEGHLLWRRPWSGLPLAHETLPWPYLDCRAARLFATPTGVGAEALVDAKPQVETGTGDIGDPQVPIKVEGDPMRLWNRRLTYKDAHAAMCSSDKVTRAKIVDLADEGQQVRIGAVAYGQGKTAGYWEITVSVDRERWTLFGAGDDDRLAELSKRALVACGLAEKTIWAAAMALFPLARRKDPVAKAHAAEAQNLLIDGLGPASLQEVADLMAKVPDPDGEGVAINSMCARHVTRAWSEFTRSWPDPLALARATLKLNHLLRDRFQTRLDMAAENDLRNRVHAVIAEMDRHLTPENRASIRGAGPQLPLAAYVALSRAPRQWVEGDAPALPVLEAIVRALGRVRHRGPNVGRVLAQTEYPEIRMTQVLNASGPHLVSLLQEAVRWIVARDVESVALTDVATVAIADASGDLEARELARRRLAMDYARLPQRAA